MSIEVLKLSGIGINPYSVRGITQVYFPIDESSQLRRTINGTLVNVGQDQFKKYGTTIGCEDMSVPLLDGIFPGQEVVIECVADLGYDTAVGGAATRPIVPGSQRQIGDPLTSTIWLYKPILTCKIISWDQDCEMWGKVMAWTIDFEEV